MGLDIYLNGNVYFFGLSDADQKTKPTGKIYRLGYWRKHPDLHGYIVENFADGKDDCRPIHLCDKDMLQIIEAIETATLPSTTGFFFGESVNDTEEKYEAIRIFRNAIKWREAEQKCEMRSVIYQASW